MFSERNSEHIGGIRKVYFNILGETTITGRNSGRELYFKNTDRRIIIMDKLNEKNVLFITVLPNGYLKVTVFTKGFDGDPDKKHPDLYAFKLITHCIEIFQQRGIHIRGIRAEWLFNIPEEESKYLEGDNSKEYLANLELGMDKCSAASQTWTGRMAAKLGFGWVRLVREDRYRNGTLANVMVWFVKERR